ncbi:hypothetical protein QVD17_11694 [Tagetes erecta]|uniref:NAC domain-containing protein n=1 Tax=Tagetes erecta TaxID=13708 RepID=A0AAD8KTY3_TARER|nr:hypothetical protein QVD17_11694 [Tagetes erecta]
MNETAETSRKRRAVDTVCCSCVTNSCQCGRSGYDVVMRNVNVDGDGDYLDYLPVGYRFNPTDEEVVKHYLLKKMKNEFIPMTKIREADIYVSHPKELVVNYPQAVENTWYFFTPRIKKYPNGNIPARVAGPGYWKATGPDKIIRDNGKKIGGRKSLVYYEGRAPSWRKTEWMMHEFVVEGYEDRNQLDSNKKKFNDYVLCRIYINKNKKDKVVIDQDVDDVVVQQVPGQNLNPATPDFVENNLPNQDYNQQGHLMVLQNYQSTQNDPMTLNSTFPPRLNHEYASNSSYFAPTPQQPCAMPALVEHVPHEQVNPVMQWSDLASDPLPLQVSVPPFQEDSECDPGIFLAQINDHMYDLNVDDFDLFGDTISCDFMGKIELRAMQWENSIAVLPYVTCY